MKLDGGPNGDMVDHTREDANAHFQSMVKFDYEEELDIDDAARKIEEIDLFQMAELAKGIPSSDELILAVETKLKASLLAAVSSTLEHKLTAGDLVTAFNRFIEEERAVSGHRQLSSVLGEAPVLMEFCDQMGIERE